MPKASPETALESHLLRHAPRVEGALHAFLPPEDAFPGIVHRAMRYSVFGGGKRLRPVLVIAAAEAAGGTVDAVLPTACAVELIHTYSLIHDDLPSMDNSATRRGQPTCHVVFGEAVAVLAGDALHALAFQLLALVPPGVPASTVARVTLEIAESIGTKGMVGGQVLDLLGERRPNLPTIPGWPGDMRAAVEDIHVRKTAALIQASVRAGALLSAAPPETLEAFSRYGQQVGLAFQIIDDVLDEVGEAARLGKDAQRDAVAAKLTFPSVHGVAESRAIAAALTGEAVQALRPLGERGAVLAEMAESLLYRES